MESITDVTGTTAQNADESDDDDNMSHQSFELEPSNLLNSLSEMPGPDDDDEEDDGILNWRSSFFKLSELEDLTEVPNQEDLMFTHQENFMADSPYFMASVEKEFNYTKIVEEQMRAIVGELPMFTKSVKQMAYSTRRMAHHMLSNDLTNEAKALRKKALGPKVTHLFIGMGKALEEMARVQEQMCQNFEDTLGAFVLGGIEKDIKQANHLKWQANHESSNFEQELYNYLNGPSGSFLGGRASNRGMSSRGGGLLGSSMLGGGSNHGSSNQSAFNSTSEEVTQAKITLQDIRIKQSTAEISRFNLMNHFISSKNNRNLKLCVKLGNMLRKLHSNMQRSINTVSVVLPYAAKTEKELTESYSEDNKQWEERKKLLEEFDYTINSQPNENDSDLFDICEESEMEEEEDAKKGTNIKPCSKEIVEKDMQFWETPNKLAANSRFQRHLAEGCVVEGWLYEKNQSLISRQKWNRQWYILKNGELQVYRQTSDGNAVFESEKICDVLLSTVRKLPDNNNGMNRFTFEIVQPNKKKPITLRARGPLEEKMWIDGIYTAIENELSRGDDLKDLNLGGVDNNDGSSSSCKDNGGRGSSVGEMGAGAAGGGGGGGGGRISNRSMMLSGTRLDPSFCLSMRRDFNNSSNSPSGGEKKDSSNSIDGRTSSILLERSTLLTPLVQKVLEANPYCAECDSSNPDWVSLNLGILVCINCSGVHRSLGAHISKVRSLSLDSLSDPEAHLFLAMGNDRMNLIWEKRYSIRSKPQKPCHDADRKAREEWINSKYVEKKFLQKVSSDGNNDNLNQRKLYKAAASCNLIAMAIALANGADVNWKNTKDDEGSTALQACLKAGAAEEKKPHNFVECKELLLLNGSDVDLLDDASRNLLVGKNTIKKSESCLSSGSSSLTPVVENEDDDESNDDDGSIDDKESEEDFVKQKRRITFKFTKEDHILEHDASFSSNTDEDSDTDDFLLE